MNWKSLTDIAQLDIIIEASRTRPQLIFKHSTRCSISLMAKDRLERGWDLNDVDAWCLDLLAHRQVSNEVTTRYGIQHESPQAIVLMNGMPVHDSSHSGISVISIRSALAAQ